MIQIPIYDKERNQVGEAGLREDIFGLEPNVGLMHEIVTKQLAARRRGTACTKERGEINKSTRKLHRQKGTGRARAGSARSPIRVGGGTIFGPKPRSFDFKPPRKARLKAVRCALSDRAQNGNILMVEGPLMSEVKTRVLENLLADLEIPGTALVVLPQPDRNAHLSARNLKDVKVTTVDRLNVYDILRYDVLVIEKAALSIIEERFS